jgi:phospholipase C
MSNGDLPIDHVIVLMLENRSFDHMLGCMTQFDAAVDGIDTKKPSRTNLYLGVPYKQTHGAARTLANDPNHEHTNVMNQLANQNGGFVADYAATFRKAPQEWGEVMKYHDLGTLPALHALAKEFTICDNWFSSLPGPTWPNRFFVHSGTSLGRVMMPSGLFNLHLHWYNQTTVYDRLNDQKIPWAIYHGDIPQSLALIHQLAPRNIVKYHSMQRFYEHAAGDPSEFPAYAFIEPEYTSPGVNDDHPPHDVLNGDRLIADVYNAIRHNSALWQNALLVVVWDEHGGFYDHVTPPAAAAPDHHQEEYIFDQYGVRVPALLISPFAPRRVDHTLFDHTSILKFALDRWNLAPLGNRTANAKSIALALDPACGTIGPEELHVIAPGSVASPGATSTQHLNQNQHALVAYSQYLATMVPDDPVKATERNAFMMTSAQAQTDTANDHVTRYIDYCKSEQERRAATRDQAPAALGASGGTT